MASSKKSFVWKFFEVIEQEGGGKGAKCSLCSSVLSYSGSSTSSLGKHFTSKHPGEVPQSKAGPSGLKQASVAGYFKRTENRPCNAERRQEILDKLSQIIYQDLRPLSMVRTSSFRSFLNFVEPNFRVPSLRKHIVALYDVQRIKLSDQIQSLALLSLSTDHWTSAVNDAYLGITAHGMNKDWEIVNMNLGTAVTSERHTSENIANDLRRISAEWNIPEVFAVVHDNAANITNAVSNLDSYSVPCFAHTIQLAIKSGLAIRPVSNLLANSRSLSGLFRKSNPAWVLLKQAQQERDPTKAILKPIQDVPTRWNSSFLMLRRLLLLKDSITQIPENPTMGPDARRYNVRNLRDDEWYLAQELTKILEPLWQATEMWWGEKYVSISITYSILCGSLEKLIPSDDDLPALSSFKGKVRDELNRRFGFDSPGLRNKIPVVACALDPRFKMLSFIASNEVREAAYAEIERLATKHTSDTPVETEPTQPKKQSVLQNLLGQAFQQQASQEPDTLNAELSHYRELRQQDPVIDPLQWWKAQQNWFPRLAHLARIVLAVPVTSAPAERLFSAAGELLSKKRLRMEPHFADKLLFLRENNKTNVATEIDKSDSESEED